MGKSSKVATGGTVLLKTAWSVGMVVASHGGPPRSPAHRTRTALTVLLDEAGREEEFAVVFVVAAGEVEGVGFTTGHGT